MIRVLMLIPAILMPLACALSIDGDEQTDTLVARADSSTPQAVQRATPRPMEGLETSGDGLTDRTDSMVDRVASPTPQAVQRAMPRPMESLDESSNDLKDRLDSMGSQVGVLDVQSPKDESEEDSVSVSPVLEPFHGDSSVEEKILNADIIIRATMTSHSWEVVANVDGTYSVMLEFQLDVAEYLKGTGPSRIVAVWIDGRYSDTSGEAIKRRATFLTGRDARWDDRQALVFMAAEWERIPDTGAPDIYYMGTVNAQDSDSYQENWLPAAAATVDAGGVSALDSGGQEFLLKPYRATPATIRLDDLKAKIESPE